MKKLLCALLALLMAAPLLIACSGGGDTSGGETLDTSGGADETTSAEVVVGETDRAQAKDDLPSGLDFDGQTITFFYRDIENVEKYTFDELKIVVYFFPDGELDFTEFKVNKLIEVRNFDDGLGKIDINLPLV